MVLLSGHAIHARLAQFLRNMGGARSLVSKQGFCPPEPQREHIQTGWNPFFGPEKWRETGGVHGLECTQSSTQNIHEFQSACRPELLNISSEHGQDGISS